MKKLIFSFFIFVIAGFAAQTIPVHAATSPTAAAVLGAEEAKILAQTLGVLKIVLEDMQGLVASAPSSVQNRAELTIGLEAISGKLALIGATIESQALAYAKRTGETESAALPQGVFSSPTAVKEPPPLPAEPEEVSQSEQVATLKGSVGRENIFLWIALALFAIAGTLFFFEWRKKRDLKVAAVPVEEPQKPIMPMVREDMEGIPPDY